VSLRTRILLASSLLITVPLLLLAAGIRSGVERRLTSQYTQRVGDLMEIIGEDLAAQRADLGRRLARLKDTLADDNRFRLAVVEKRVDQRPYLLDSAGKAMGLMGLDMLQIQDEAGLILSSGHFRNEYDRAEPALPRWLAAVPDTAALVAARRPAGGFFALARCDSLRLGERRLSLVGGLACDGPFLAGLARGRGLAVSLVYTGGALSSDPQLAAALAHVGQARLDRPELTLGHDAYLVQARDLPLLSAAETAAGRHETARLVVTHPLAPLRSELRSLDLWLGLILLATLAGTLILATWLAGRLSRPLNELARQTARMDLDRLDADFRSDRRDEVGTLSRFLAAMQERLRLSVQRLREAERRATLGELARQVNHDIKNGLAPLRHVLRHLGEVAERDPTGLATVFQERRPTLDSSLGYLADLAANYARLSQRPRQQSCDLNRLVRTVFIGAGSPAAVHLNLGNHLPTVQADPVGLRRIIENLLRNALDSLAGRPEGRIEVSTSLRPAVAGPDPAPADLALVVADNGCGIPAEDRERIFADFYTTKPDGTGLGLSIVRRLVADFGGRITCESEPGRGTIFTVLLPAEPDDLPAAGGPESPP
jgi:signal transduction histidine kinase